MSNLKIGGQNVGKIYLGDKLLLGGSIESNTDKYIVVSEGNTIYFIDIETLEYVKKVEFAQNVTSMRSFGKILKVEFSGNYHLYINSLDNKTENIIDNYGQYSDAYCEDNVIVIAEYNFMEASRVTLKVNYPIATNLSKNGNLSIGGYTDEDIVILGKYKQYYVITFYYDSVNYLVNEQTLGAHKLDTYDSFAKMLVVEDIMYGVTVDYNNDSLIYKIDSYANIIAFAENTFEDADQERYYMNKHFFYFDNKIIAYNGDGSFVAYDKNLNIVFTNVKYIPGLLSKHMLLVNGKLWLIASNGDIIIRSSYNDTNTTVVKKLVKDDGSNFTEMTNACKTEIDFN